MKNARLVGIAVVLFGTVIARGATITVTTTEPDVVADGMCSFAEAIDNANEGDAHSDCVAGDDGLDVIELAQEATYLQPDGTRYDLLDDTIINGNGATVDSVDIRWWVLSVQNQASCSLNDLIVRDGVIYPASGLFVNRCEIEATISSSDSTVVLIDTEITGGGYLIDEGNNDIALIRCTADGPILSDVYYAGSRVLIRDSHVTGSFFSMRPTQVTFVGSTFSSGAADVALIEFPGAGSIELDRSTFSGPEPVLVIISAQDPPEETSVTIRDSTFTAGSGIHIYGPGGADIGYARVRLGNSVLDCGSHDCLWIDTEGPHVVEADVRSTGFNIATFDSLFLDHSTDMVVTDVMLSELGDYGGPTPVHMPLEGSPAIDRINWAGPCSKMARDQRGYVRPADGDGNGAAHCDCGAVEYGAEPPPEPPDLPDIPVVSAAVD